MKIRIPNYFNNFKCIASKCEDTCCAGWEIVIDDKTNKEYKNVEGEFGEFLKSKITKDDDGDNIFILNNGNCSFLNENKLCDIYSNLGEKYLCHTCKQYPRYTEQFLNLKEIGLSLSCPEAARIILMSSEHFDFIVSEDSEEYDEENAIEEDILLSFLKCREVVFDILKKQHLNFSIKIAIILKFIKEVQNKIDLGDMDEIIDVIEEYKNNKCLDKIIENLSIYRKEGNDKYNNIYEYFKIYKGINHINENDPLCLDKALDYFDKNKEKLTYKHREFNKYYKENLYKFKNILVYFIFRYFMKAIFDYDMSAKIKLAVISTLMIKELSIIKWAEKGEFIEKDLVDIAHTYSKDIEHSEENVENLQEIFETEEIFETDKIIEIILNNF